MKPIHSFLLLITITMILTCGRTTNKDLFEAAIHGNIQQIKLHLKKGININATNSQGRSALHLAVQNNKLKTVKFLLKNKASYKLKDKLQQTALHIAIKKKHNKIAILLFKKISLTPYDYLPIMKQAIIHNNKQMSAQLFKKWQLKKDFQKIIQKIIILSATHTNVAILKQALTFREKHTPKIPLPQFAIFYAIKARDTASAQLFFKKGVSIHTEDNDRFYAFPSYNTPLTYSIFFGLDELAKQLIKKGANINHNPQKYSIGGQAAGSPPLFAAVYTTNHSMVNYLLRAGANINIRSIDKRSALHIAAARGNAKMVKLLIDNGASLNFLNRESLTPLVLALKLGHTNIAHILLMAEKKQRNSKGHINIQPVSKNIFNKKWAVFIQANPGGRTSDLDSYINAVSKAKKQLRNAFILQRQKKYQQAAVLYKKILKQYANANIYQQLGDTLSNISKLKQAIKAYKIALILKHTKPHIIYYNMACAYSRLNKISLAFQNLNLAIKTGYKAFHHIALDKDLKNIRNTLKWHAWLRFQQRRRRIAPVINNIIPYFKKYYMNKKIWNHKKNMAFTFSPNHNTKDFNLGDYQLYAIDKNKFKKSRHNSLAKIYFGENGLFRIFKNRIELHSAFAYMDFKRTLFIRPAGPHGLYINGQFYNVGKKQNR